ncbi:dicarboxylate/amino acid:cation symporter [Luteimonas aestuarii]|uniref:Dicarboxylate/amino acid:cation symporter n=1 Tax=Luteimonas aestuarii TaxID=453837 RepID=A0A4R5U3R7_9GAMM|nr:dicarboxylate/amino acid:cation symporter [Luteimonas aestuarii]TDK28350.1 dicarboxylate/amino acid:cation symporter [Luteimonas aestuarii]
MTEPARRHFLNTAPARVLLALVLGATIGIWLNYAAPETGIRVADAVQPIGRLWLNALQMTVVPLVAALIVVGINSASDAAASGRTARMSILVFVVLLAVAGAFAAIATPALLSSLPRNEALTESFSAAMAVPETTASTDFGLWISSLIPSNAIAAAAAGSMLPLVVFAMFFGFALTRLEVEPRARMLGFIRSIGDTMLVIVRWVLWIAPLGVFALVLAVSARVGLDMLQALLYYVATQSALYITITVLLYGVAVVAAGEGLRRFASALVPVQAIAASTQSSVASLPVMIDSARTRLGYPLAVTSLTLPMAVSLFRIASPPQYIVVACFIAWMMGIELTAGQLAIAVGISIVISMGSVGLPGQVSFMTNNTPVTQAMGLPVEPLALLLVVDTIPDVFATVANTSADMAATAIVARRSPGHTDGEAGAAHDG